MRCDRCSSSTKPPAPMLQNETWKRLAKPHEALCAKCAFARARKRRVTLTFDDLLPCVFNIEGPWFDKFRAAEHPEKSVLPERAYAWQAAILEYSGQLRCGLATAPSRAVSGTVLAVGERGFTLRDAPEGGICRQPDEIDLMNGEKYLKVYENHRLAVEILIRFRSEGGACVEEIIAPLGPNSLGAGRMRSVFRLLQLAFPGVKNISGYRSTGIRLRKPAWLSSDLGRITGYNYDGQQSSKAA